MDLSFLAFFCILVHILCILVLFIWTLRKKENCLLSSALMVLERVQQFLLSVVSFTRIVELMDDSITSRNKETADFFTKTILTVRLKAV